jgi:hypothetical protein
MRLSFSEMCLSSVICSSSKGYAAYGADAVDGVRTRDAANSGRLRYDATNQEKDTLDVVLAYPEFGYRIHYSLVDP